MKLVDTSVWIDHFRFGNAELQSLLERFMVVVHPFVIGELACGNLKQRSDTLHLLKLLPTCRLASDDETLNFIEHNRLMGKGIGYVDAHLLASVALTPHARLMTADRRLARVAEGLGLA